MVREPSQRDRRQAAGMAAPATSARANVNLALVKYWGKRDRALNLPATGSISLTLDGLSVEASVAFGGAEADRVEIDGVEAGGDEAVRVARFLDVVRAEAGRRERALVATRSTVPRGVGLASSAAAFAALALAARRDGARRDLAFLPGVGGGRGGGPSPGTGGDPHARPGGPRPPRRAQRAQDARRRDGGAPAAPLLAGRHRRLPRPGVEAPRRGYARLCDHRCGAAGEGAVHAGRRAPRRRGAAGGARRRARAHLRAGRGRRGDGVRRVTASAPGKLFLAGEDAGLAGAPALVAAVDRRAHVRAVLEPGAGPLDVESLAEGTRRVIHDPERDALGGGDAGAVLAALRIARTAAPSLAALRARVVVDTRAFLADGQKLGLGRSAATVAAAVAALLAGVGPPDP